MDLVPEQDIRNHIVKALFIYSDMIDIDDANDGDDDDNHRSRLIH